MFRGVSFIALPSNSEFKSRRGLEIVLLGVGNMDEFIISSNVLGAEEDGPTGVKPNADGEKRGLPSISEKGVKLRGVFLSIKLGEPILTTKIL